MYGHRNARLKSKKDTYNPALKCSLGGYTFAIQCRFLLDDDGDVKVGVVVFLQAGEWDNNVEWPFAKKIWVNITHPRDHEKDIWRFGRPQRTKDDEKARVMLLELRSLYRIQSSFDSSSTTALFTTANCT
ncbi:hypothetical protein MTO96_027070 [Rhipicephalus appendiculatus]